MSWITAHVASEKAFGFIWTNVTRRFQQIQVLLNQVYEFKIIIKITCMKRVLLIMTAMKQYYHIGCRAIR